MMSDLLSLIIAQNEREGNAFCMAKKENCKTIAAMIFISFEKALSR